MDKQLTVLAHDMRTPITTLKMAVALLASMGDPEQRKSLATTAVSNLKRLEEIADKIDELAEQCSG